MDKHGACKSKRESDSIVYGRGMNKTGLSTGVECSRATLMGSMAKQNDKTMKNED